MSDLSGKKGLILGVGNQRSIAWAIAEEILAKHDEKYMPPEVAMVIEGAEPAGAATL